MKNRAKCRKCNSIIESTHNTDYVSCRCGEIALDCVDGMKVYANDLNNIIRIDDEGNEIKVTVKEKEKEDVNPLYIESKPSKEDLIKMLDEMAKNIENLPSYVKQTPVNQYDLLSLISLLSLILKN